MVYKHSYHCAYALVGGSFIFSIIVYVSYTRRKYSRPC